ncbi:MAG TPA: hypothetical protein VFF65_05360 [Phycisphaerales bacterium]|nr:hypothetical protein [Phycisphaerales bacterium]
MDRSRPTAARAPARRGAHWIRLHANLVDDEGSPLRLDLDAARRLSETLPMPQRSWLYYSVTQRRWVARFVAVTAVVSLAGFAAIIVTGVGMRPSSLPPLVQWVIAISVLPFPLLVLWGCVEPLFRIRRARRLCLPAFRAARLCAGCHYPLSCVPADAGGLTRCPECGLAWRIPVEPVTPPASPAAASSPSPTAPPP